MENYQIINSVARSADILKCISTGITKITDISNRLQINKAAVHRILKTLEIKELVVQDPVSRQYFLGPVIQTIAANPLAVHKILVQSSIHEMESLENSCGETVVLQTIRGGQRVVLEKVAGNEMIRYFPEKMEIAPIHAGAGGRVLLAGLEEGQMKKLLRRLNFEKITSLTITDIQKLELEIEKVKQTGYAVSFGENVENSIAIAVPVTSYSRPVALVVIGPDTRMKQKQEFILKNLLKAGAMISKNLTGLQENH
jgi:DNA-binding IclR family transcriptional regulator